MPAYGRIRKARKDQAILLPATAVLHKADAASVHDRQAPTCGYGSFTQLAEPNSYWSPVNPLGDRMGVNARLMDPEALKQVKVRHLDGAGSEQYVD